jgi:multicomponent Na+:H+ antiporter subunit F
VLAGAAGGLLVAMALVLIRAMIGPTPYDRILAMNSFGAKTVLVIGVLGFAIGRPAFLDIAIAYALINFVATIGLMKFFRYRSLQAPLSQESAAND